LSTLRFMVSWENQYIQLVTTKPDIIVAEADRESPFQSKAIIGQKLPSFQGVYVEIGSGSGLHLLKLAELNPAILCIGLEIRFKRAFKTGEKAESLGLKNVLVLRTDARNIDQLFDTGEVSAFFVNYPDPWDKRRWKKNRILNEAMLGTMHRLLKPGGYLRYKTDHAEYFHSTAEMLSADHWERTKYSTNLLASEWISQNIPTEFEYLFKSQEKPLHLIEVIKKEGSPARLTHA
jgi:tRNA (guanine-N7-)-methyltransferase